MDEKSKVVRDTYVVAAFSVKSDKSILYTKLVSMTGLKSAVQRAVEKGADYISLRIIRPEVTKVE